MTASPVTFPEGAWQEAKSRHTWHDEDGPHFETCPDPWEIAADLLSELRNLPGSFRREVSELRRTVEAQGKMICELQAIVLDPPPTPRDEYAVWVESKDADNYVGMYVAFVPGVGPISAAETIKELRTKLKDEPLAKKAAIVTVPDASC